MNSFGLYRQGVLGMVSDREIMSLAGDGDWRNLWKISQTRGGGELRRKLSVALGTIERKRMGGKNAPEWVAPCHNLLVEVFAKTVERYPCPR